MFSLSAEFSHYYEGLLSMAEQKIFEFLTEADEGRLRERFVSMSYQPGETIIDQDCPLRAIYIIKSGQVRIERVEKGNIIQIANIGEGEFIGEISFADGDPTSARAVSVDMTEVYILNGGIIDHLTNLDPAFGAKFYRSISSILSKRLRKTSTNITKKVFF